MQTGIFTKKGADPELHKQAAEQFRKLKEYVKKAVRTRRNTLIDAFLSGEAKPVKEWKSAYLENGVLRKIAETVVWTQGYSTFILTATGAIDHTGSEYTIDENTPIGVAHPIELEKETLEAWRSCFDAHKLKQLFEQIWEPVIVFECIKQDRYMDCHIPVKVLRNCGIHGIDVSDYAEDWYTWRPQLYISCADVEYELDEGNDTMEITSISFKEKSRRSNHVVFLLDKCTIRERILKDDPTIGTLLDSFTLPRIMSFIDLATKNECVNATAVLLEYRNEHYPEYDGFAALDDLLLDDDF